MSKFSVRLAVLSGYTLFCIDHILEVEVDAGDNDIGDDVEDSDSHQHLRIIERYFF